MTNDLVKRLRADELPEDTQHQYEARMELGGILNEAADRIEELEKLNDASGKVNLDLMQTVIDYKKQIDEATDRIEELEKFIGNMQEDVAFLRRLRLAGVDNWEGYEFALEDEDD